MRVTAAADGWITGQFEAFDTVNQITVPVGYQDSLECCHGLCQRLHRLLSPSLPRSDICRLNQADGELSVAPETAEVLEAAVYFGKATGGLFDVTVAPAVRLWDWKHRSQTLPDQAALDQAAAQRGLDQIQLSGTRVRIPKNVSVDVGGIAKGYIADQVTRCLEQQGVPGALINLGGNISLLRGRSEQMDWRVGIRQPDGGRGESFALFRGRDLSVVTSAASERYCQVNGVRYHHLLDPASGRPANGDLASVTIISPSSTCADALSTACFVGGGARARAILARFASEHTEGILLYQTGHVYLSQGLRRSGAVTLRRPEMLVQ